MPFGELPKGVITMHAVVQPSLAKVKTGYFTLLQFLPSYNTNFVCQRLEYIFYKTIYSGLRLPKVK